MSIKYCFNQEIHKTLSLPCNFTSLVKDISSLFVQKLPADFLLQYQDADGDKIAITNDNEYQALIEQELPTALSSVKIYVTPLTPEHSPDKRSTCTPRTNSNGSFEIVESENSLRMEEIVDFASLENENDDEHGSKVVVSLQIPNRSTPEPDNKQSDDSKEEAEPSFSCSASARSKVSEPRDLVQEMSLSMADEEEASVEEGDSFPSKAVFNRGFQTEEENPYLSEESPKWKQKKFNEGHKNSAEKKSATKIELPSLKEKKSDDFSNYLNRIVKRKSLDQSLSDRRDQLPENNTPRAESKQDQSNESPEKWVSFSSHHEETPTQQGVELQGRNLFMLKQKPEAWFVFGQEKFNRYQESEDEEPNCSEQSSSLEKSSDNLKSKKNWTANMVQMCKILKDEEPYEQKEEPSFPKNCDSQKNQTNIEVTLKKNTENLLQDLWRDLEYSPNIQCEKLPAESLREDKIQVQNHNDNESDKESEDLNMSLLSSSEARRIESAIGCIGRIAGVKKLKICPEPHNPIEKSPTNLKQDSPIINKWAYRKLDFKPLEQEEWPFLKQCEAVCKKEVCDLTEKKMHEGTFCMGCWESPICGPRYVCLICDDIEYCESCEAKISHYHPLLKVKEPMESIQDFVETICAKVIKKSETMFTPQEELASLKEESINNDNDRSLAFDVYKQAEEPENRYEFEYKEMSSTPLMIRSNEKEWCVVYKTICLWNTGNAMWKRCHFEPIGLVPGTITEVSYLPPGDTVLVTLEIHGFFAPGKYNSIWRVVHQGEMDELCEMGHIDLEFEVMDNRNNMFNKQFLYEKEIEDDMFDDY